VVSQSRPVRRSGFSIDEARHYANSLSPAVLQGRLTEPQVRGGEGDPYRDAVQHIAGPGVDVAGTTRWRPT